MVCIQTLMIVGDGPARESLDKYSRELGLQDKVIFTGYRHDIPRMLAAMDIFVLPSLVEGIPVSLLEAMAMEKPIVASRVGGIPEVIQDGIDGILVTPASPDDLSTAIMNILKDKGLRDSLGSAARKTSVEQFSIQAWTQKIDYCYQKLLAGKGVL